jgi:hypothetical protein
MLLSNYQSKLHFVFTALALLALTFSQLRFL